MSVTSTRTQTVTFTGDTTATLTNTAAANASSTGSAQIFTLSAGFLAFTVPTSGTIPTAVTIIPPPGNAQSMLVKGITGDTGIRIHNTDPTTIALDPSVTTFGITAGGTITGLYLVWI